MISSTYKWGQSHDGLNGPFIEASESSLSLKICLLVIIALSLLLKKLIRSIRRWRQQSRKAPKDLLQSYDIQWKDALHSVGTILQPQKMTVPEKVWYHSQFTGYFSLL